MESRQNPVTFRRAAARLTRKLARVRLVPWLVAAALLAPETIGSAQVRLEADGPGNTYELLSSVLGGNPYEVPDCGHPEFGRHITEEWNEELEKYVFVFHIHVNEDDDRCVNFDRQRNEIKTYGPSPANVKGAHGEVHSYRWKFWLDAGFQPSPNFTHIFQIKAGDGSDAGAPIITITPRAGNPERLQIIFTPSSGGSGGGVKTSANLSAFKGQWIEAHVRTLYTDTGTFEITLSRISDGAALLAWSSDNLDMWRDGATFNRPKWGIYRSLNSSSYLRDERVLFADFCIAEGTNTCAGETAALLLECAPGFKSVFPGQSVDFTVKVESALEPTSEVNLAVGGLPPGAVAGFDPPVVSDTAVSILNIATASATPVGSYPLTITGMASAATDTTTATLIVSTNVEARPEALVAWLNFDDGTANDSSGRGNHGTLLNGTAVVDDADRGKVLHLDGADDYVDLGTDASLDLSDIGQATIAAWVKVAASKSHNSIVTKGEWRDVYSLLIKGDTTPSDLLWTGNDTSVFSGDPVPLNTWTHVAVVINGDLTTFYINGQVSGAAGQDRGDPIDNNPLDHTEIGREDRSDDGSLGRWYFNGQLDDVRIYEAALAPLEILSVMVPVTAPVVSTVSWDGADLWLHWTGGAPPYQVEAKTSLNDSGWSNHGEPINGNSLAITPNNAAGFYRVQHQQTTQP